MAELVSDCTMTAGQEPPNLPTGTVRSQYLGVYWSKMVFAILEVFRLGLDRPTSRVYVEVVPTRQDRPFAQTHLVEVVAYVPLLVYPDIIAV